MALENKRSLLQPSSTQAQQYRLQFSNLAPGGVAPASISNQQPAPVANSRPAVSAFVSAPAPVSLQAPPTIPPALPVPVIEASPTPPAIPVDYAQALYFDGSTVFTASLGISDVDIPLAPHDRFGIMFAYRSSQWRSNEVLFSFYSGSYASASLEIRQQNGTIQAFYWNTGGYKRRGTGTIPLGAGSLGNGYTLVTLNHTMGSDPIVSNDAHPLALFRSEWYINAQKVAGNVGVSGTYSAIGDFISSDHFDIGGIQKDPSLNFNGHIAFIAIKHNDIFTQQEVTSVFEQKIRPVNIADLPNVVRVYTSLDGLVAEYTGSAATTQVPLGIDGTVYPDNLGSYYI